MVLIVTPLFPIMYQVHILGWYVEPITKQEIVYFSHYSFICHIEHWKNDLTLCVSCFVACDSCFLCANIALCHVAGTVNYHTNPLNAYI